MEQLFKNRISELADRSYNTNTYTFTEFLGLAEISDLLLMERDISHVGYEMSGGYENADRKVVRFGNAEIMGYEVDYPIVCIHIEPLLKKFADDLNHRDFLGALMNIGIERSTLGDIIVNDREAYLFCLDTISDYICTSLSKVKHTNVKCNIIKDISSIDNLNLKDAGNEKQIVVSSERIDGIISKVYNLSRSESLSMFVAGKVFVNGRMTENNSQKGASGDVINVRGYGKFRINTAPKETRKGKLSISVNIW